MRSILFFTFCVSLFFSISANAQTYEESIRRANREYNAGRYNKSLKEYRNSIQADPTKAEPYRNLARSYFWLENYVAAVAYYDFYLEVDSSAEDFLQIRKERNLANTRAGTSVYRRTKPQEKIYQSLKKGLKSGQAFSEKGGAFRVFQSLLETGFAEPVLIEIKAELSRRLIDEFDAEILPKKDEVLPIISAESWNIQSRRLEAIKKVTNDEVTLGIVKRRTKIILTMDAILSGDSGLAATLGSEALRENPDLKFLSWFVASSLLADGRVDLALKEISVLARSSKDDAVLLDYVRVLRGLAIQQKGRHEDAAEIFSTILLSK